MTDNRKSKTMSFYATPTDQETIQKIQALRPHYGFNFMTREGLTMLLQSLEQSSPAPRPRRQVEYTVAGKG
ncbi:MAG: hypothetical protein H8E90_08660 [Anaerolineales bacterium]|nr:hypothetical protein [Anaerolineales bacterium]